MGMFFSGIKVICIKEFSFPLTLSLSKGSFGPRRQPRQTINFFAARFERSENRVLANIDWFRGAIASFWPHVNQI
jgi:hypothetical protein